MVISTLKIPLLVVGAVATTGVGVLVVKGLPFPNSRVSLSSLLSKDLSKRAIGSDENDFWLVAWKKYQASNKDIWNLKHSRSDVPKSFKLACENKLGSKVESKDSEVYEDFLRYCTRDTLVSDLIKENASGKELIARASGSSSEWQEAWRRYRTHERNAVKTLKGDIWDLKDWDSQHSLESAPESFISKCEKNSRSPFYDISGDLYLDTLAFCTKNKVPVVSLGG